MSRFSSIRSKVWLCVLTALGGFFVSVLVGFYANLGQYNRLSQLQENYWPLVSNGDRMLAVIHQQNGKYEDAFLLGEQDLAQQAITLQVKFLDYMDDLILWVQRIDNSPVTVKSLLELKQDYVRAMRLAIELRPTISLAELTIDQQQEIQRFGPMQADLEARVKTITVALNAAMSQVIEENKQSALYNLFFLTALFLVGLLAAVLTVNRVAGTLLVSPLSRVLDNVRRLETGQELEPPKVSAATDEIGQHLFTAEQPPYA